MIPRIISRVWLGPNPIPEDAEKYWAEFKRLHPGWTFRTWGNEDDYSWLRNRDLFESATTWTSKSDVLRFEILASKGGGIYVDTDVEPLKAMDPLLSNGVFAGREDERSICGAVIGAEPGHPAILALLEALPAWTQGRPSAEPHIWAGPAFLTAQWSGREDVELLAPQAFYPIHWSRRDRPPRRYPSQSYVVHHWARQWAPVKVEPAPSLSLCMAWTDRGDPWRREVKDWVEAFWRSKLPEAQFILGTDDKGETFSRSAALNDAARRADGDVLFFLDADCCLEPETVLESARLVVGSRIWVVPWYTCDRLNERATRAMLESDPAAFELVPTQPRDLMGQDVGVGLRFGGFCEVVPRAGFEAVGGWPEKHFVGWGSEDIGFSLAMDTLWGPHYAPKRRALHLYHPRPKQTTNNPEAELAFWKAYGRPEQMRSLLGVDESSDESERPKLPHGWLSSDGLRRPPGRPPPNRIRLLGVAQERALASSA